MDTPVSFTVHAASLAESSMTHSPRPSGVWSWPPPVRAGTDHFAAHARHARPGSSACRRPGLAPACCGRHFSPPRREAGRDSALGKARTGKLPRIADGANHRAVQARRKAGGNAGHTQGPREDPARLAGRGGGHPGARDSRLRALLGEPGRWESSQAAQVPVRAMPSGRSARRGLPAVPAAREETMRHGQRPGRLRAARARRRRPY